VKLKLVFHGYQLPPFAALEILNIKHMNIAMTLKMGVEIISGWGGSMGILY
jgi:hypothetical protein